MASVNNLFIFLILFVFGFTTVRGQSQEIGQLENYFYKMCSRYSGTTETFNKLRADVYEMHEYFKATSQLLPARKKDFCNAEVPRLTQRVKTVEADMKSCLPRNDTFLAGFIRESFQEFLKFLCSKHQSAVFSSEVTMCREKIESSKSQDLDYCLNRIFPPSNGLITKKDLCEDLAVARKCIAQLLERECQSSDLTKNLNQAFFDYIQTPCNGCAYWPLSLYSVLFALLLHYFK